MSKKEIDSLKAALAESETVCRNLATENKHLTETLVRTKRVLGRNHPVYPPDSIEMATARDYCHKMTTGYDDDDIQKLLYETEHLIQMIPISEIWDNERVIHFKVRFRGEDYCYALSEDCLNQAKLPDEILAENITQALSTMVMNHIKKVRESK